MPLKAWLQHRVPMKPGRHGLPAEVVRTNQRGRLLEAAADLAAERGVGGVSAVRLSNRAGVSRSTLYDIFDSKDDCIYTAAQETMEHLLALTAEAAAAANASPPRRLGATIDAFTTFCAEHPSPAQLVLLELPGVGNEGTKLRCRWIDELTETFRDPVFEVYPNAPALTPELLTGGLWHVAVSSLVAGDAAELPAVGRMLKEGLLGGLAAR